MNKLRFKWGGNGSEKKDKEPKNYVNGGDHYSLQPDTGEYCQDPAVQTNGDVPGEHPGNSRVQFSPGAASPAGWTYYVTQTSQEEGEEDENRRLRYVGKRDYSGGVEDTEIVSRNGTVRGVKNRVRAGLAHFTSLTQGAQKSYSHERGRIIVYTTSMQVVRDTAEKCQKIRRILESHRVRFEERDVVMNLELQRELRARLGQTEEALTLPQVFIDGQPIGGAERLDQLNEAGELRKLLSRFEKITVRSLCARCGGYRYIPCTVCNGSRKSVHRNNFTDMFRQLNCTACNENGLQRCPVCDEDMEEEHVSYI
ncbi:glutaredoxin domain-containing cysteine-rich protein 1-like isoform X2 [Branchiostoma floridae]|uniref:Glutaredoxin domain-containing cysteine-rich protein 1-like isoform X2 n=1 Tax=Branchiostoma floridae TaxID=7739 RepID=A0A9J7MXA6_BRAFL|nr:glutaredoxin domain-containing cysteine-rich protein 1-like isoform X2 [Branchiostoma floridae]